jgi:hypothetical protein
VERRARGVHLLAEGVWVEGRGHSDRA